MKILRDALVAKKLGSSRATVWRWAKDDPEFPKPVKLSAGITGWIESEVDAYIERRIAAARREGVSSTSTSAR